MEHENRILECITSDYTWEQIMYDIVAWEGMDPWNIDISVLSESFMKYMNSLSEFDFHVPSKYVIVAAMLLRMKSSYIKYVTDEVGRAQNREAEMIDEEIQHALEDSRGEILQIASIEVPPKRLPTRMIVLTDLVNSLKKALSAQERKEGRRSSLRKKINMKSDDIAQRIASLYEKITQLLGNMEKGEMHFSDLVTKWDKDSVVNTFLPVVYLDNQKKIEATQEEMFRDILIKKRTEEKVKKKGKKAAS
ncbi:MAG: segregation/condensation protein A [Candidatus Aenigmarchaeota archaeon]|nr:segregation/condensation protein A [Candidatus Aenigmarchaeota archaeon]